jgi:hypothetical protein
VKTMAKSEESKPRCLSDDREYAEALARLEGLNVGQQAAIKSQETLESRMGHEEKTRQYASQGQRVFSQRFSDQDLDGFAAQVAITGDVSESMIAELRSGQPAFGKDEFNYSGELVNQFNDARRRRIIFDRAVVLQKKEVKWLKVSAIKALCESVRGDRERIARVVANSLLELGLALREENAFAAKIGLQDEGIQADIMPRRFPVGLPWEQLLLPWIAEALGISEAEARSKAGFPSLDLERKRQELDRVGARA